MSNVNSMLRLFFVGGRLQLKYPDSKSPICVLNVGLIGVRRGLRSAQKRADKGEGITFAHPVERSK